jgi:hypothetical protein
LRGTVATTVFVAGSIRDTVGELRVAEDVLDVGV